MKSTEVHLDLAKGNIKKLVIQTAVPMVIAQIVSMLYIKSNNRISSKTGVQKVRLICQM